MTERQRLFSLDALRGFAILDMILIHFVVYWSPPEGEGLWIQVALNHLTGADFGAAAFLMLAGMGQALSLASRPRPATTALRGLLLFLIGLSLQLAAWGPVKLWQWDILPLIGVATLVLLGLRRLPSWALLAICLLVAGLTPWLRQGLDLAHYWGGAMEQVPGLSDIFPGLLWDPPEEYLAHWNPADILNGFLLIGEFPVFPWIIHPILGLVLGRLLVAGRLGPAAPRLAISGLALALAGLALALAAAKESGLSPVTGYQAPLSFYPTSFTMLLMQTGLALAAITSLYYFLDYKTQHGPKAGPVGRALVRVGLGSLSVYFIHYLLIAWPLRLAAVFTGEHMTGKLTSPWLALGVGLAVVLALQPFLAWWMKRRYVYGLEWCLAAVGAKKQR